MTHKHTQPRRGAALIIAIVLLACIGVVAGTVLPQMLRDRQETRTELIRQQARQLLDDTLRSAEVQRRSDAEFSGETFSLGPEHQPFDGTFQITTKYQEDRFNAEVEYRDKNGKLIYATQRGPQQ